MAPKPTKSPKSPKTSAKSRTSSKGAASKTSSFPSKSKSSAGTRATPKQVKTRPGVHAAGIDKNKGKKKKAKVYTDKELGLPTLNMITPVGVEKPRGKKKGKIFVDDQESMMTILAIVNAEKEGQIESKIMRARQMEEIREAKRNEAEMREEKRNSKLEATKDSLRKKKKPSQQATDVEKAEPSSSSKSKNGKKRVSFA